MKKMSYIQLYSIQLNNNTNNNLYFINPAREITMFSLCGWNTYYICKYSVPNMCTNGEMSE